MKQCVKCGRTSPPALAVCPRCKTPLNPATSKSSAGLKSASNSTEKSYQGNRAVSSGKIIIFAGIAIIIILALAGSYYFSDNIKRTVRLLTQKVQGKEWKYPPGDAAETARAFSVQYLIEMWETFPPEKSKTALHATYAKALGLKGREAVSAVAVLSPYVLDKDLYLRQGAMAGLAGIGEEGLPYLVKALKYPDSKGGDAATIRWDAAIALATMGPRAKGAMQDLLASLTDPKENPNVKGDAAVALAGIGSDAVPSLSKARCYFYDQGGISPTETGVLRTINIALSNLHASPEPCKGSGEQPSSAQTSSSQLSSTNMFLRSDDLNRMQVPQLLDALRSHPYNTREIADELVKKGAKAQAAEVLTAMLQDRNRASDLGIKMALGKLGVPITFDKSRNVFLPIAEDNIGYIDFSAETKGDVLYSSGKIYIGRDVADGLSRKQSGPVTVPTFVKYTLTVKGGSIAQPIEKTFDVSSAGDHAWENVMLASGIGQGKYTVSLFLHAQYTRQDGSGMILNNNAGFLEVER